MSKTLIAFFLGLFSFFICQFLLSRGNPNAFLKDWPIMLALDAVVLVVLFPMAFSERLEVIMAQGGGILLFCCGGTLAGAFVASKVARRKARPQ